MRYMESNSHSVVSYRIRKGTNGENMPMMEEESDLIQPQHPPGISGGYFSHFCQA
jgi:hypothetical protein